MADHCDLIFDKEVYRPGELLTGKIDCFFSEAYKVSEIRIRFQGKSKTFWKEGRNSKSAYEMYFETEAAILRGETVLEPGKQCFRFDYQLPVDLPSSMEATHGSVKYKAKATIDRPWAIDFVTQKLFTVFSHHDLNENEEVKRPIAISEQNKPLFFGKPDPVWLHLRLPFTGFVPSQMIKFSARIQNDSNLTVKGLRFELIQGFTFHTPYSSRSFDAHKGQMFEIVESSVAPNSEKSWDNLEIRVPPEMYNGNLYFCTVVRVFWELRGEVLLPMGHNNIRVRVPLTMGAVPLHGITLEPK